MPALGPTDEPRRPTVLSRFAAPSFADLRRRQADKPADSNDGSEHMINLMLTVLGLVFLALILVSLLVLFRRRRLRRQQNQGLPTYNEVKQTNPRGLTIETAHDGRSSILIIGRDGQPMLQNPNSPPHSPDNVPEIHITFPDEHDGHGRAQNGRVLVVRVGDNATVGLEPMRDEEQLPAYEKEAKGEFQSIDMDQIGGLKEKDRTVFQ
ncbi:hypothetical protein HRG_003909 [Hirsutella rhossiliensis]|uniref:Uncharacterized protein n=1 Tax=Hirsutella rhossiliensis TaxID=111463 RepID=A0A9P8N1F1_9HYPO|nr:uncharacterized protein HRG_03909 [Hirsutella rhossiliensis]KAH0965893.1 hypothetical protein HRG_03909 [Hirsutella rhossiliensis]